MKARLFRRQEPCEITFDVTSLFLGKKSRKSHSSSSSKKTSFRSQLHSDIHINFNYK